VKKRVWLILVVVVELFILVWMFRLYGEVEQKILNVQGQFAYRYEDLHQQWLQVAGALVLVGLSLPFTLWVLVRSWSKP
jgi:hypothetical protein